MVSSPRRIPCQVIAGPLGIGKTTAILAYLKRHRDRERIGLLVNDFGAIGIDGTIMAGNRETTPLEVISIPGGCLCCATPIYFEQALTALSARNDLDRIFIEPSGLVLMTPLKRQLLAMAKRLPISLLPFIVMIPPARVQERHYLGLPFYRQMVDEADVLVANYCDKASAEQMAHFHDWTQRLQPPKRRILVTHHGQLPDALFHDEAAIDASFTTEDPLPHHHHETKQGTWESAPDRPLQYDLLLAALRDAQEAAPDKGWLRLKGIVFTDHGWRLVQWTPDTLDLQSFPEQNGSKVEWILRETGDSEAVTRLLASTQVIAPAD